MKTNKSRGLFFWLGRLALTFLALIVFLAGVCVMAGEKSKRDFAKNYPPIGQLVDIGGYRLHIFCTGQSEAGEPTVIIEAGSGSVGLMWSLVQSETSRFARICTYDRAGLGWSEPSPHPRTSDVITNELHTLLANARVVGPYILVGHSLGGIFVREYQYKFPQQVAGIILVDSGDGDLEKFMAGTQYMQTMSQFIKVSQTFSSTGLIKVFTGLSILLSSEPAYPELPAQSAKAIQAMTAKITETGTTEVAALPRIWEESRAHKKSMGNLPLTVIVHGHCSSCSQDPAQLAMEENGWLELQKHIASLSTNSRLIVANPQTGHDVQIDQPGLIVDAILAIITQHD